MMQTRRRLRKLCGARARDMAMCFTGALEQVSALELFLMERFFTDGRVRRRRVGMLPLTTAGRVAIAESVGASRRWLRAQRLRGERGKRLLRIRNVVGGCWRLRPGMQRRFEVRWWRVRLTRETN